jgi:phosphopantothenoylcysteine synthetase/decarboxylase
VDRSAAKVKSSAPELWLRLVRTPKLVDRVRSDWRFAGVLVKFKLEAGISEEELHDVAERSRLQSNADLMVANTLEGAQTWAILGPAAGQYDRVSRADLPARLLAALERLYKERAHG